MASALLSKDGTGLTTDGAAVTATVAAALLLLVGRYGQVASPFIALAKRIGAAGVSQPVPICVDLESSRTGAELVDAVGHQVTTSDRAGGSTPPPADASEVPKGSLRVFMERIPSAVDDVQSTATSDVTREQGGDDVIVRLYEELGGRHRVSVSSLDGALAEDLVDGLVHVYGQLRATPDMPLRDLDVLAPDVIERAWAVGRGAKRLTPGQPVTEAIEYRCRQSPTNVAFATDGHLVTYAELDAAANGIANALTGRGVTAGDVVGILLDNSPSAVIALLGVWKAGAAFLPLSTLFPSERLHRMLNDADVRVVITDQNLRDTLPGQYVPDSLLVDAVEPAERLERPTRAASSSDLAYVMHTSGSTGASKGVEVTHAGIWRLILDREFIGIRSTDVVLQLAPLAFDASTFEIWPCLAAGGRLEFLPGRHPSLRDIGQIIQDKRISALWLTAGLFHHMAEHEVGSFRAVRRLFVGGDVVSPSRVRTVLDECPGIEIVNGYGPTEATTFTCCHLVRSHQDLSASSVPIGRPIVNTDVYLLDSHMQPVPHTGVGELWVAGPGVARGYLNRSRLTEDSFVTPGSGPLQGIRLYRTGDYCRWGAGGFLEFVGRRDSQVKVRGYRVDTAEVESVLEGCPGVVQAAVVAADDKAGSKFLVAVVKASPGIEIGKHFFAELRSLCARQLPPYMVPQRWRAIEIFPLNRNGKLDRNALLALKKHGN
ncbi:amino acid adenylation domain-containing protein [Streptomyces sp. NPDC058525]|uniref:amino acid adenylation domain-containing protein n=1 Tax=Streptomyces sp. NPDC058525 TaxID=3346538 RepID=UPI003656CC0B